MKFDTELSKKGRPILKAQTADGRTQYLNSRYDPVRETLHLIKDKGVEEADCVVVIGESMGYLSGEVLKRMPSGGELIVIYGHEAIKRKTEKFAPEPVKRPDIIKTIMVGDEEIDWPQFWERHLNPLKVEKLSVIVQPACMRLFSELFGKIGKSLENYLAAAKKNLGSGFRNSSMQMSHLLRNLDLPGKAPGIAALFNKFDGQSAVLVGAGPSLDKNIDDLKKYRHCALILALDTALQPLLHQGITPHFVISMDASVRNAFHLDSWKLYANSEETPFLVGSLCLFPQAFAQFEGSAFYAWTDEMKHLIPKEFLLEDGLIDGWGSVSVAAVDFLFKLGCCPIILAGVDFAYSEGKVYCRNTSYEKTDGEDFFTWNSRGRIANNENAVMAKDIHGHPQPASENLMLYRDAFIKKIAGSRTKIINATEGGILNQRVKIMTLEKALKEYAGKKSDYRSIIRSCLPIKADRKARMNWRDALQNRFSEFQESVFAETGPEKTGDASAIIRKAVSQLADAKALFTWMQAADPKLIMDLNRYFKRNRAADPSEAHQLVASMKKTLSILSESIN